MKMKASAITAAALLALTAQTVSAAEAVGYNVVTVPANSDVLVSVPFNQNTEGSFTVSSVTADGVTVTNGLTANAYTNGYYVRFTSGGGEGLWSTISANGTGGFTMANTNVLTYVSNGDAFRVYKHHTVGSVFPSGMYGVSYTNGVAISVFNNTATGIYKSPSATVTYSVPLKRWSNLNQVINPDSMFLIRNGSAVTLTWVNNGDVPDYNVALLVPAGVAKDTLIGSGFPVDTTVEAVSAAAGRSVSTYNNAATGIYKSPTATVTYSAPLHRWSNLGQAVASSEGLLLRTSASEAGGKITIQKPY
ncbi:MAG: TIGR02597 family protein [Kiritimatiellales bacterium]